MQTRSSFFSIVFKSAITAAVMAIVTVILPSASAFAAQSLRWTYHDDTNGDFAHIVSVINEKTTAGLTTSDFLLFEDRDLANSHFRTYIETAQGLPLKSMSVRVWTNLKTGQAIQVEALVENVAKLRALARVLNNSRFDAVSEPVRERRLIALVRAAVAQSANDPYFRSVKSEDVWENDVPVRIFSVKGKRGKHIIKVSLLTLTIIDTDYREFQQADGPITAPTTPPAPAPPLAAEFSVPARVYRVWEEPRVGRIQSRVLSQLMRLKTQVARVKEDPYTPLRTETFLLEKQDPILGITPEGQAQGFWSMPDVKERAALLRTNLPLSENSFANGVILEGRYATVSLHPDAGKVQGLTFKPELSSQFKPIYHEDGPAPEMVPTASLLGRPLTSYEDAFGRIARRTPNHDVATYINDGFDEVQVYWAIDTLVDTLHGMGFQDPELSQRAFHAFLYDPDISMRDNAFYTDDTINFTTYSPQAANYARDNSTIWHELGHGIMDRLMGDLIVLNDTGGLAEGMADYVAALVIHRVTNLQRFEADDSFRIINNTGFFLTNESHDDGEAYGGAMYDFLVAAEAKYGANGVVKAADLTMEAMRLTRNHPALTAPDWFSHMIFADELGHAGVREPGELKPLIEKALASRNFTFDGKNVATFEIDYNGQAVEAGKLGSRSKPVPVALKKDEKQTFSLKIKAKGTASYPLNYPLKIRVGLTGGPLQGAIHWEGEEAGDKVVTINSEAEAAQVDLTVTGCDEINREDGSCVDFAYVQIWPETMKRPLGKKRFYLQIKP